MKLAIRYLLASFLACSAFLARAEVLTYNIVLEGAQETPPIVSSGSGSGTVTVDTVANSISLNLTFSGLSTAVTGAHLHGPAARGSAAGIQMSISTTSPIAQTLTYQEADEANILAGLWYVNIHTTARPGGELRGQVDNQGAAPLVALTVNRTGSGTVTSSPAGISCGATCQASYPAATFVTLTAEPANGFTFTGWTGGSCSGTGLCHVTMNTPATVGAVFTAVPPSNPPRSGFNGDAFSDIFWRDNTGGLNYQWQMNGLAITGQDFMPSVPNNWTPVALGDVNGDGRADIFWREAGGLNYLWTMNGLGVETQGYFPSVPSGWVVTGMGDATGDGKADIFWRNATTGENYFWALDGLNITTQGYFPGVSGTDWEMSGIADYSGDGKVDALWRNKATGDNYLWILDGLTITGQGFLPGVPADWEIVGSPNADGNTTADVFWRNKVTGDNYAWLMNGLAITSQGFFPPVSDANWKVVGFGDYNGDGKGDILWRNPVTGAVYLWMLDGLTLTSQGFLPNVNGANWMPVK